MMSSGSDLIGSIKPGRLEIAMNPEINRSDFCSLLVQSSYVQL